MEALIGFAIGYYVGTRDGREGLQKALGALDAITKSEEFKNLPATSLVISARDLARTFHAGAIVTNSLLSNL